MNATMAEILTAHIRTILDVNDPDTFAFYDEKDENSIVIQNKDLYSDVTSLSADSLVQIGNYLAGFGQTNEKTFSITSEPYFNCLKQQSVFRVQKKDANS